VTLPGTVLAFYGDDFTGSTDVMEALSANGLPTVLFLQVPDAADVARFPAARAVGVAGIARARSPEWMDAELPSVFRALGALDAPLVQYKVCSTFDSSPRVGSIGRALDIGRRELAGAGRWTPIVVGAPVLRRYCVFGNLFATADGETHRLDRHPTMSRHPVTPMDESDLRRHLAAQTDARIGSFDILGLHDAAYRERFDAALGPAPDAMLLDVLDDASLARVGELVWSHPRRARFAVGSSGLDYALVAHFRAAGLLGPAAPATSAGEVRQIAVISGSCSPVTAAQIRHAGDAGYAVVRADPVRLARGDGDELRRVESAGLAALAEGRSVVAHTALGPDDPAVAAFNAHADRHGGAVAANEALGGALGRLLGEWISRAGLRRACVAGGDTSSRVCRELGLHALTFLAPLAPGSPLCRAHGTDDTVRMEIALKGGQVGGPDYFECVRNGGPRPPEGG
jgi:uncharacterized protein YgbK (DUF1537 family)